MRRRVCPVWCRNGAAGLTSLRRRGCGGTCGVGSCGAAAVAHVPVYVSVVHTCVCVIVCVCLCERVPVQCQCSVCALPVQCLTVPVHVCVQVRERVCVTVPVHVCEGARVDLFACLYAVCVCRCVSGELGALVAAAASSGSR